MNDPRQSLAELASSGRWTRSGEVRVHAPGDVLAERYKLVSLLGEGGMGSVWKAHCLLLDIDVAIKVLRRELAGEAGGERLLREAQATAKLGHPAIVRVFDFGLTEEGEPFLVMELLKGEAMAGFMEKVGRLPAAQAVQLVLPIADGLAAAHAEGIIHRDVKPENILLAQTDAEGGCIPKVVDFGIAKVQRPGGRVLTHQGMIIGSVEYMSPEQARGTSEVGAQTDVWALGVVLYELLCGRRPFDGGSMTDMLVALQTATPTPTVDLAAGDEELWAIVERALRRPLDERWPSMKAFGRALAGWALARGITVDVTGASLAHRWHLSTPDIATLQVPAEDDAELLANDDSGRLPVSFVVGSSSHVRAVATTDRLPVPSVALEAPVSTPAPRAVAETPRAFSATPIHEARTLPAPSPRRKLTLLAAALILGPMVLFGGVAVRRVSAADAPQRPAFSMSHEGDPAVQPAAAAETARPVSAQLAQPVATSDVVARVEREAPAEVSPNAPGPVAVSPVAASPTATAAASAAGARKAPPSRRRPSMPLPTAPGF